MKKSRCLKFYLVKYQGKYITNYIYKNPENNEGWVLSDCTREKALRWHTWRSFEVNSFKKSGVELEIEEILVEV